MKSRACMIVPVFAIGLAIPAGAQQISQQEADQAARGVVEAFNKALHAKDAAGIAALYTEDAIRVTPNGTQIGRAAIERGFAEVFKVYTPEFAKINQVALIGNDVVMSVNSWAGTYNSPNGPVALKGYATFTDVRDGGWKIRVEAFNETATPPLSPAKQ